LHLSSKKDTILKVHSLTAMAFPFSVKNKTTTTKLVEPLWEEVKF